MATYRSSGVQALNSYIWTNIGNLSVDGGSTFVFDAYRSNDLLEGISPIFPSKQIPEMNNIPNSPPYLVYNTNQRRGIPWWITNEQTIYNIYGMDETSVRVILARMADLLRREDWTASEINAILGPDSPYTFKCVYLISTSGINLPDQEGGRYSASITISYDYTIDLDSNGLTV